MGHHNIHFYDDPHALEGAWSPPDSRANFCEEDYLLSFHLAEFINSLTNLTYIFFALRYIYSPTRPGYTPSSLQSLLNPQIDFMSLSLLILGLSSFAFHATMRQSLEFADEIAMLFMTWSLLRGILTSPSAGKKRRTTTTTDRDRLVDWSLGLGFFGFSGFYVWSGGQIIYHTICFAGILVGIVGRCWYLFEYSPDKKIKREKVKAWRGRAKWALAYLVVGYVLWNVDLEFCEELRRMREMVGLPWAWGLELHGWWHVLTAISANQFMGIVRELREELSKMVDGQEGADRGGKAE